MLRRMMMAGGGGPTDPFFANVALLLHCEASNGSSTFVDSSSYARTCTAVGNAQHTTSSPLHGTSSGLLDGSGDWVNVAHNNADYIASGAFCIEITAVLTSLSGYKALFSKGPFTAFNLEWTLFTEDDDYLHFYWGTRGSNQAHLRFLVPATLATNTPYRFMVQRNASGDWLAAVDGTACTQYQYSALAAGISYGSVITGTFNNNVSLTTSNSNIGIGRHQGTDGTELPGKFDEVRFTVGQSRYTGSYTPSSPFPDS